MRHNAHHRGRYSWLAGSPLVVTLLAATIMAPATAVRAQQPATAASQAQYEVAGTMNENGMKADFRAAFHGDRIQAIREYAHDPKLGDSTNMYTYGDNQRLVRFEGDRPSETPGQSATRVKEVVTWDAAGKVTSSSRTVGGKPQPFPPDVAKSIYSHGDELHGEAERVRKQKGLPSSAPAPVTAPAPRPNEHPASNTQAQVVGHWSQNGMNADYRADFVGDRVGAIREYIRNPKGAGGDSVNNYTFDEKKRLRHFDGDRPSRTPGQTQHRVKETLEWDDTGKVTSSKRVAAGKEQPFPPDEAKSIYGHGDKLAGEAQALRRQQMAQKK
jgi:hypothetical protein